MNTNDVHRMVQNAYTEALERAADSGEGCCGKRTLPRGYENVPQDAPVSFGCGNPLAFAAVEPGSTVVDLGSGAGLDLLAAAERVGPEGRVIGVDMTDAMIAAARQAAARAGHAQIEVRKGIIEDLPVESASADWVFSNCVINLSPDKERVFREIHRVLKPGGRFSISDMVVEGLPEALRAEASVYCGCVGGAIAEAEYLQGLRRAGLADVEVVERADYGGAELEGLARELGLRLDPETLRTLQPALKVTSIRVTGRRRS